MFFRFVRVPYHSIACSRFVELYPEQQGGYSREGPQARYLQAIYKQISTSRLSQSNKFCLKKGDRFGRQTHQINAIVTSCGWLCSVLNKYGWTRMATPNGDIDVGLALLRKDMRTVIQVH